MVPSHKQQMQATGAQLREKMRVIAARLACTEQQRGRCDFLPCPCHASAFPPPAHLLPSIVCLTHSSAAGGSLARRLIDVYFTVFKMVLDGKIGTAAQVNSPQSCLLLLPAAGRLHIALHDKGGPTASCLCTSLGRAMLCPPAPQLAKAQADKAAEAAAKRKKGEAAKVCGK